MTNRSDVFLSYSFFFILWDFSWKGSCPACTYMFVVVNAYVFFIINNNEQKKPQAGNSRMYIARVRMILLVLFTNIFYSQDSVSGV